MRWKATKGMFLLFFFVMVLYRICEIPAWHLKVLIPTPKRTKENKSNSKYSLGIKAKADYSPGLWLSLCSSISLFVFSALLSKNNNNKKKCQNLLNTGYIIDFILWIDNIAGCWSQTDTQCCFTFPSCLTCSAALSKWRSFTLTQFCFSCSFRRNNILCCATTLAC